MANRTNNHDVFSAVADKTRRRILDMLTQGELAVLDIVKGFSMSQPSISEHLRILRHAGLVQVRKSGRQRLYHMNALCMAELTDWVRSHAPLMRLKSPTPSGAMSDQFDTPTPADATPETHSHVPMEID